MSEKSDSSQSRGRIVEIIGWGLIGIGLLRYLDRIRPENLLEILVPCVALLATMTYWIVWKRICQTEKRWCGSVLAGALAVLGVVCRVMESNPILELVANLSSGLVFAGLGYLLGTPRQRRLSS